MAKTDFRPPGGTQDGGSASTRLRHATRDDHRTVDAAFARFAIGTATGYGAFLAAHARVLPQAERLLAPGALLGEWHGRSAALAADLHALGCPVPRALDFALPPGEAARWGAVYVIEGSRLGGAVLARSIPRGAPAAFLGARHGSGDWRRILRRLDRADAGAAWREGAVAGAKAMFAAYVAAASAESALRPTG